MERKVGGGQGQEELRCVDDIERMTAFYVWMIQIIGWPPCILIILDGGRG